MIPFGLLKPLLPLAWAWAARAERNALQQGVSLSAGQLADAVRVGVAHPERVRVHVVERMPWPAPQAIIGLLKRTGVIPSRIAGLTLRYAIYLRKDCLGDRRLLAHELAHTAQYERLGGFPAFLTQYLREWLTDGYPHGELELEAQRIAEMIAG